MARDQEPAAVQRLSLVVNWSGDIVIPGRERDASALAEEIRQEFRHMAMSQFGDTMLYPGL